MKTLELNLVKIDLLKDLNEEENYAFRVFLKGQDFNKVDKIVHRLNSEISSQIDCTQCGNCCKLLSPILTNSEIERLSSLEKLTPEIFKDRFLSLDLDETEYNLKETPCRYLKDKKCEIYSDRPEECKSYPHTHKNSFISRTLSIIDNYGICPIVFNIYENLKIELGYK